MSRLTKKQVQARLVIYDNIINYLISDGSGSTPAEQEQAKIVQKQIDNMANAFLKKHLRQRDIKL